MYEEKENKIDWSSILKKVGIVAAVLLVIFGIFALVNSCTKKKDDNKPTTNPTEISLENELDELERATLEYLSVDNLPTEINASKTIRLKILINRNLTSGIVDSKNNTCDTSDSYSEVTRLENSYAVKMSLSCGGKKADRVIYVGCFENCNGGICKGDENLTGGICETKKPDEDNKPNDNNTTTTPVDKPSTPSNGIVKPNFNNNNSNNNNSNNSSNNTTNNNNNSSNNNSSSNNTTTKKLQYQQKRCSTIQKCPNGDDPVNGGCLTYGPVTLYGVVETQNVTKTSTYTEKANVPQKTTTRVTLTLKQFNEAKKAPNTTFKAVRINTDGTTTYDKTVTSYGCKNGVKPVNGVCTYTTNTTVTENTCKDKTYTYNKNNNTCTKLTYGITKVETPKSVESCETMWSYSKYVSGWTFTGSTK